MKLQAKVATNYSTLLYSHDAQRALFAVPTMPATLSVLPSPTKPPTNEDNADLKTPTPKSVCCFGASNGCCGTDGRTVTSNPGSSPLVDLAMTPPLKTTELEKQNESSTQAAVSLGQTKPARPIMQDVPHTVRHPGLQTPVPEVTRPQYYISHNDTTPVPTVQEKKAKANSKTPSLNARPDTACTPTPFPAFPLPTTSFTPCWASVPARGPPATGASTRRRRRPTWTPSAPASPARPSHGPAAPSRAS